MSLVAVERRTFTASLDCNYLVNLPAPEIAKPLLAVALHGYGMNARTMLDLTSRFLGPRAAVVSLEAPNQFYLGSPSENAAVGFNWGTREHWGSSIRLHHEMVRSTLRESRHRLGIPAARCFLLGFSQPVSLNYRFLAAHPGEVRGAVAVCGGLPGDWMRGQVPMIAGSVLHIARTEDEYYSAAAVSGFEAALRSAARDVEFHVLPGKHRFPSSGGSIASAWMHRVWGEAV